MKYRALVADDEWIIRKGIISFLERYENFEVVAEAEDGEMALEMAKQTEIDVYFVDITMPFLNGLEFIGALKEIQPKALTVIISGYDRFEYAQEAIRLETFEYLLKPIQEEVFDEMIQRLTAQLDKLNLKDRYLRWANVKLKENRMGLIEDFLQKVIQGRLTGEEIEKESAYLSVQLPETYTLLLLRLEYKENEDYKRQWNEDLMFFVAQNVAKEIFADIGYELSCHDEFGNVVLLAKRIDPAAQVEKTEKCRELVQSYLPVECTIVCEDGGGEQGMKDAYQEAVQRLKTLTGGSAIIKQVRKVIEENYTRADLSLQDVADEVNFSVQYISKLLNKEMGCTFIDYLTNLRIRKSIELLYDDRIKMYEIAEKVGYSTQHYFSAVFKKKMGVSPNDFRKNRKADR